MAIDLSRVKGLCFDVDGTLSDTDDEWVSRFARFFHPVRLLFHGGDPLRFSRWFVMVIESPMNLLYYWADSLSLDDNFARLFERLAKRSHDMKTHFILMHGAGELLKQVAPFYPLTVVSARDERSTFNFLDQFNLRGLFCEVVTSQTCEHTKPYPQPVQFAAQQMELKPEECLMIGDTTVDILSGKLAGAQTIGLLCGFGTEKELRKAGADLVLRDLLELQDLFTAGNDSESILLH